jgi:hypothetical protein
LVSSFPTHAGTGIGWRAGLFQVGHRAPSQTDGTAADFVPETTLMVYGLPEPVVSIGPEQGSVMILPGNARLGGE